ncbi:beta-1,6-N-acetylglucosaminyltransferase [Cellulosimicrobium marinum]|uniref:beta-1,6-N-acetylglucosaminyltransferase n=1 Tax=Cellulosimicrobium marinum TaxID=1638992 RepID=UPI001E3D7E11|nr:beta-1,6-N-acetylglucosaminyltransferase [Cellulosimicrobium marinum]MCB7137047.1 hypothetical protein [Cellulosimicrobium marinum]
MSSDGGRGRCAYLVLGHRRPEQVTRLARRVLSLSPDAVVLVHWDASATEPPPRDLPRGAHVIERRVRTRWGDWSLVEATLALLAAAAEAGTDWSVLVSGEDWPVRDLAGFEDELRTSGADAVLRSRPVRRARAEDGRHPLAWDETRRYGARWFVVPRPSAAPVARVADAVTRRLEERFGHRDAYPAAMQLWGRGYAVALRRAPFPEPGWTLHKGDQWMALGSAAREAALAASPAVLRHFSRTLVPDESFLQSVLHNTPGLVVHDRRTTYAPWERFDRLPHLVLRPEDLDAARRSRAAFARKVGDGPLAAITDDLDALVAAG